MAETLAHKGCNVTIVTQGKQVAGPFDPDIARMAEEELQKQGVKVFLGEEVIGLKGEGNRVAEVVTKRGSFPAELVIVAVGVAPNSEMAVAAGLRTGLNEAETRKLGLSFSSITHRTRDHAGYYPDAKRLYVKLLYATETHVLLGAQLIGYAGTKRIDTLAVAITAGMTLEDIITLDLAYAPPFSGVWDPVQQAAREALKNITKEKGDR
jgi:NADPH-dependent 2,4-dienoyl-CoA reductase/sulfur reductase-like enzyme